MYSQTHKHIIAPQWVYSSLFIFYALLTYFAQELPFFWDNMLFVSKTAHYYYENQFTNLLLPLKIDSGHPPFYGMFMAGIWTVFGKSLALSHWVMYPILVAGAIAFHKIAQYFLPPTYALIALLLYLLEPCILTQSVIASIDMALLAATLWAVAGILYQKRMLLALAFCLMAMLSLRGSIAIVLLFFIDTYFLKQSYFKSKTTIVKILLPYMPAAFIMIIWLGYHFQETGFFMVNNQGAWAEHYDGVSLKDLAWNLCIIVWRMLDNGRIVLWLLVLLLGYKFSTNLKTAKTKQLLVLLFVPLVLFSIIAALRHNPILHRYFMLQYALLIILSLTFIAQLKKELLKKGFIALLAVSYLSAHFWIYPYPYANGWDATLAHLPYYSLKDKMQLHIDIDHYSYSNIVTEFPAVTPTKITHLKANAQSFQDKEIVGFNKSPYILQSNVMNDFTLVQIHDLQQNWKLVKEYKKGLVYMRLYKNPSP